MLNRLERRAVHPHALADLNPATAGRAAASARRRFADAAAPCVVALLLVASPLAARELGGDWPLGVAVWLVAVVAWFAAEWSAPEGSDRAGAFALAGGLFAASFFALAWIAQPTTLDHHGMGWDGVRYFRMYYAFNGVALGPVEAPYGQRIGLPLFASYLPGASGANFGAVATDFMTGSMLAWVAGVAALGYGLRAHSRLSGPWIVAIVAWACLFYASPDRNGVFMPYSVDAPAFAVLCGFLVLARARRLSVGGRFAFCLFAGAAGALFKETALMWSAFGFAGHAWVAWRRAMGAAEAPTHDAVDLTSRSGAIRLIRWHSQALTRALLSRAALPWLALTIGSAIGLALAQIPFGLTAGASNVRALAYWVHWRLENPLDFVRIVVAWLLALAPFSALALSALWRRLASGRQSQPMSVQPQAPPTVGLAARDEDRALWIALALWAVVSAFSGLDLTRFAFSALPIAAPLIVRAVGDARRRIAALSFAVGVPLAKPWLVLPSPTRTLDAPPMGWKLHGLTSWVPEYAHPAWLGGWIVYLLLAGALIAWLRRGAR